MVPRKKPPITVKSVLDFNFELVENLQKTILSNVEVEVGQYFDDQIDAGVALLSTGSTTSTFIPKTPSRKAPLITRNRLQEQENLASKAEIATKLLFEDEAESSEPTTSTESTGMRTARKASKAASNKIKNTLQFEKSTAKLRRPDDAIHVGNIAEPLNGTILSYIGLDESSGRTRKLRTRRKNKVLPSSSEEEEHITEVKEQISTESDQITIISSPEEKKRSSRPKKVTTSLAGPEVSHKAASKPQVSPETEKEEQTDDICQPNIIEITYPDVQMNKRVSEITGRSSRGNARNSASVKTPDSSKNPAKDYGVFVDGQIFDKRSGKRSSNENTKCSDTIKSEKLTSSNGKKMSLDCKDESPAALRRSQRLVDAKPVRAPEPVPAELFSMQESVYDHQLRKSKNDEAITLTEKESYEDLPKEENLRRSVGKNCEIGPETEKKISKERSVKERVRPLTSHTVASKYLDLNGEIRSPTPDSGFHSASSVLTNQTKEGSKNIVNEVDESLGVSRNKPVVIVTDSSTTEAPAEQINLSSVYEKENTIGSVIDGDSPFLTKGLKKTKTKVISKLHKKQTPNKGLHGEESPNKGLQYVTDTPITSDQCNYVESSDESLIVAKKSSKEMEIPQKKRTRIIRKKATKEDGNPTEYGEEIDENKNAPLAVENTDVEGLKAVISVYESHTEKQRTRVLRKKEAEVIDEVVIEERKHEGVSMIEELLQQTGNVPPKPRTRKVHRKNEFSRICETKSVIEVSVDRIENSVFILPKTPPKARTRKKVPRKENEGRLRTRLKQHQTIITEEAEEPAGAAEKKGDEDTTAQPDTDPIKTLADPDLAEPNRIRTRRIQRKEAESKNMPSVMPPAIAVAEDGMVEMPKKRTRLIQKTTQPKTQEKNSPTSRNADVNVQPVFERNGIQAVEVASPTRTRSLQKSNGVTELAANYDDGTNAQFDGKDFPKPTKAATIHSSGVAKQDALISNTVAVPENIQPLIDEKSSHPGKPSEDGLPKPTRTRKIQKKNVEESKDNASKTEGMEWEETQPISGIIEKELKPIKTRTRQKKQELDISEDNNPGTRTRILNKASAYKPPEIDTVTKVTKMPLAVQSPVRNVKSPRGMIAKVAARNFTPKRVFSPFKQLSVKEKASAFESGHREEEDDFAEEGNRTVDKGASVDHGTKRKSAVSHNEEPTLKKMRTPSPKKYPVRGPLSSVSSAKNSSFSSSGSGKGPTRLARLPFLSGGKSKSGNIVTGVKSFLSSNRQPPKLTEEEVQKKKEEELRAKEQKEREVKRKKEQEIRRRAEENKRKREQKMKEVMMRRELMKQEEKDEKVQKFMAQQKQKAAELEQKNAEVIRKQKDLEGKIKLDDNMKSQKFKDTPTLLPPSATPATATSSSRLPPSALKKTLDVTRDKDSPLSESLTPKKKVGFQYDPNNYGIDDLDSGDETDDDQRPKKTVPEWAKGQKLKEQLLKQSFLASDLKSIFPPEELLLLPPDLSKIFSINKSRYNKRTSSAIWNTPPGNMSLNASRR